ncbi:MAG: hypothetical protein H8E31_00120 [Planctomycetes bacterium]|nr:hypothetical protein [Planctomycetota bacterium]
MITGTNFSPAKAFLNAARDMLVGAADNDYGIAFRHLDANADGTRWTKTSFLAAVANAQPGEVTTPLGHSKSAKPSVDAVVKDTEYLVKHRIPLDGRWSGASLVLRFTRKGTSGYFHMRLEGIERL